MTAEPRRAILHVDMDAFFASVEVLDDPSLRGKPVIVGGTPEGRGVVAAASYEAREYGVRSAMSAARAVRLCPQGVFLRGRMARYAEISGFIFDIFHDVTPLVEPLSVDEAFLDVTGCRRLLGDAETIGRLVKRRILDEVGLVASVGVAPNKFLAKLASDLDKPDGFTVVPDDVQRFLDPLDVGRLWGVGPRSLETLHGLGVRTIGDLRRCPPVRLETRLGAARAAHVQALARGEDSRPVVTDHEAKSIGHEITFAADIGDRGHLTDVLDQMADKVGRRLRRAGARARTVQLKARDPDFTTHTRARTLPEPSDATRVLRDTARELLAEELARRARPLRLLGVSAQNLVRGAAQPELFADPASTRDRTLDGLLDSAVDRFGKGALTRGLPRFDPGSREGREE
ncbi:MAG TPA: DNA polymerase IV [Candidatus Krumholzibacteria bacterium]|nr:DNA polymerase IV [Candidatus Krumholzibacteria bacterium]HRX51457.1 DNA polymerase IV [Candidatus Krumholzibacteria bacterium]